ncbi:MAG: DUF3048 domain-containing protein [Thermovenabulum sp.]|uniref:DUF3048 domain-containing protein n=1 Tax=Thermovenabulum sp. TaxID=3100335 RepID=UPI003C79CFAF
MSSKKKIMIFLLILCFITTISASCSSQISYDNNSAEKSEKTIEPKKDTAQNDNTQNETILNPLTGLLIPKQNLLKRPFALVVENEKKARPQSGLDKADVVFEVLAEGGITRFLAIYMNYDPDKDFEVGPIRSARPYLIDFAKNYNAIFVHYGGSPQAYSYFKEDKKFSHIDGIYDNITFYRDKERSAPHNAYTSIKRLLTTANKSNYYKDVDIKTFEFSDEESFGGYKTETAQEVEIVYNNNYKVTYRYESSQKVYKRYINDDVHIDRNTQNPLFTKNLLILYMNAKVMDKEGRLEINTFGTGNGFYITEGESLKIKWKKGKNRNIELLTEDNKVLKLRRGNIWIQVVPQNAKVKVF